MIIIMIIMIILIIPLIIIIITQVRTHLRKGQGTVSPYTVWIGERIRTTEPRKKHLITHKQHNKQRDINKLSKRKLHFAQKRSASPKAFGCRIPFGDHPLKSRQTTSSHVITGNYFPGYGLHEKGLKDK